MQIDKYNANIIIFKVYRNGEKKIKQLPLNNQDSNKKICIS